jgi:hypothetical protein
MKYKKTAYIVILLIFAAFVSLRMYSEIHEDKPVREDKIAPPGTIKLNDSLYIDKTPVSNHSYLEFLSFIERSYSQKVRDSLKKFPRYDVLSDEFQEFVKSNVDKEKELYQEMLIPKHMHISWDMSQFEYQHHPYYRNHPVVNVTTTQAQTFCEWRTDMVMLNYAINSRDEKQRSKYYSKIQYRLPSPEEWEMAMEYFSEFWITDRSIFEHDKSCTFPALEDRKNKKLFQYVPRNIAEMSSEKDIAMGLSWYDRDTTDNYFKTVRYTMPHDYLGFRCICEIIEY